MEQKTPDSARPAGPASPQLRAPRRVGVIGCGRIARPVLQALQAGEAPGWVLGSVLARSPRTIGAATVTDDVATFLAASHDLVIEAAGPAALATHGERALLAADVWTVSAAALADRDLHLRLEAACLRGGHRLRLLTGAIAGLDGVATVAVDPDAELRLEVDLPTGAGAPAASSPVLLFRGSVRDAAAAFPDGVNVAVAAALAGPGMDRAVIDVVRPVSGHRLALAASSRYGRVRAVLEPAGDPRWHPVAAGIIACLRRESRAIWAG